MQELFNSILSDYEFVGESYDKKGNFLGYYYLYSKTVQLFPSQVEILKNKFPNFNIHHLYLNWYIIGFKKTNQYVS